MTDGVTHQRVANEVVAVLAEDLALACEDLTPEPVGTGVFEIEDGSGRWEVGAYFTEAPDEIALALLAGWAMSSLHPERATPRNWRVVPRLIATLFGDIVRSNIRVARLILTQGRSGRRSAFLEVPLQLRSPTGLAVLSIILTVPIAYLIF